MGTAFPTVVPYRVFHASDRQIGIAVGSEKLWAQFCTAIERPDLTHHPDYASNALRIVKPMPAAKRVTKYWQKRMQLRSKESAITSQIFLWEPLAGHPDRL